MATLRLGPARRSVGAGPVAVLGTGGSGTRAVQLLMDRSGYFTGSNLNNAGDALDIGKFVRRWDQACLGTRWMDRVLEGTSDDELSYPEGMDDDFQASIQSHREAIPAPDAPWGWKVPRTIFVLPFVHRMDPDLRVVHLIRDGRDMAYSSNQNQLHAYSRLVLTPDELDQRVPIRSITFWSRVNLAAARYAEKALGKNYLRMRYEDLCADPAGEVVRLIKFMDAPASRREMRDVATSTVHASSATGFWREYHPHEIEALQDAGGEALRAFGYL